MALLAIAAVFYYSYMQEGEEEPGARMAARFLIRLALSVFAAASLPRTRISAWFADSRPYWIVSFALVQISYLVALIWVDVMSWEKPLTDAKPALLAVGAILYSFLMLLTAAAVLKIVRPWWAPPRGLQWTLYAMWTAIGIAVLAALN